MTTKTTIFTHRPRVSLARFPLCWWRHNRLLMTSRWLNNCDAIMWILVSCFSCHRYVHRNCTGLTNVDFELAVSNTTWFCRICNDNIFPLNHLDDDDFLKAVCEMSQTTDIFLKIGNESRLFHPFELNEDENDILDYHGDLDPDKCYFNQYSHSLIKNCNYFVEETFNKYLLKHNVSQH